MAGYHALDIANYILSKTPMTNLRLQKILYFIQGESYRKRGCEAFTEDIVAWMHGPVVPEVYAVMSPYGAVTIPYHGEVVELEDGLRNIVDQVVEQYKDIYVWDLVGKTHEPGTPWYEIHEKHGDYTVIPKEKIRQYFEK